MDNVKFYIDTDGAIMAYFPDMESSKGFATAYAHIGQHSACHPDYVKGLKLANPAQYYDLLQELKGQGYDGLNILNAPAKVLQVKTARGYAANWHGGQDSALYSFASTGRILPGLLSDYMTEVFTDLKKSDTSNQTGLNAAKQLTALYYFFQYYWIIAATRRGILHTETGKADNKELCLGLESSRNENLRIWIGREHALSNPDNTKCLYMRLDIYQQTSAPVCNGNSHLSESETYKAVCKRFPGFAPRLTEETINDILELTLNLTERDCKPW